MPLDFDILADLDLDHDGLVDESDIKLFELKEGHGFQSSDLNHDNIPDDFQNSLNGNAIPDQFEVDLDSNKVLDMHENQLFFETKIGHDINGDGKIDNTDYVLAKYLFNK